MRSPDGDDGPVAAVAAHSIGSPVAPVIVRRLGLRPFAEVYSAMRAFTGARSESTSDEIWLLEHPAIYTVGQAGRAEHLPRIANGIAVERTDRGGQITYHGPGQVIMYTLIDLRRRGWTVRGVVTRLEQSVIDLLGSYRVVAERRSGAPGVYVEGRKIAALGLRIRGGCSYHGLALNVAMDLTPFDAIDPCGFPGLAVTQTSAVGISATQAELGDALAERFTQ